MTPKADWITYIQNLKKRELSNIFSKCPKKIFEKGLELGAGDGFQSTLLTKFVSHLISTDYNSNRLKKKNTKSIEYHICDAEQLDKYFEKNQIDLIFSSNLLEHLVNPNRTLITIYGLLRADGITIHVIPNPFWKILSLLLYIPNNILRILNTKTKNNVHKNNQNQKEICFHKKEKKSIKIKHGSGNNPKLVRKRKPSLYRFLIQEPHGVSSNNIIEILAFSKFRWKKEFKKANLNFIRVIKGPVSSGYGFGFERLRNFLENIGFSTEYIYIATKEGKKSPYSIYF